MHCAENYQSLIHNSRKIGQSLLCVSLTNKGINSIMSLGVQHAIRVLSAVQMQITITRTTNNYESMSKLSYSMHCTTNNSSSMHQDRKRIRASKLGNLIDLDTKISSKLIAISKIQPSMKSGLGRGGERECGGRKNLILTCLQRQE